MKFCKHLCETSQHDWFTCNNICAHRLQTLVFWITPRQIKNPRRQDFNISESNTPWIFAWTLFLLFNWKCHHLLLDCVDCVLQEAATVPRALSMIHGLLKGKVQSGQIYSRRWNSLQRHLSSHHGNANPWNSDQNADDTVYNLKHTLCA